MKVTKYPKYLSFSERISINNGRSIIDSTIEFNFNTRLYYYNIL